MNQPSDLADAFAAFRAGDLHRALTLARAAAAATPSPAAQHLIGLIHCRLGDLPSGLEHLRAAASGEPANASFRLMLARALVDAGNPGEALELIDPPQAGDSAALALWHVRAEAADRANRPDVAAHAWQIMASARPSDWRAWSNLGNAHAAAGKWAEAAAALRRAAQLAPAEAPLQRNLASALGRIGLVEEAAAALETAIVVDPGHLKSRLTLARLLADDGKHQAAMEVLDAASRFAAAGAAEGTRVVELEDVDPEHGGSRTAFPVSPDDPGLVRELGLLLERTSRMEALRTLLEQAEAAGIERDALGYLWAALALRDGDPAEARRILLADDVDDADAPDSADADPVRRNRLLAKIEDALGDTDAAFAAADAMNRAVQDFDAWNEKGAAYRQRVRGIERMLTPTWAGALHSPPPSARRTPAFLVGFPRSGTTLLDTFLMGHPNTQVLEEVHLLGAAEQVIGRQSNLPTLSDELLTRAREAYFAELDQHVSPDFAGLVVDKLPLNMLGLPLIRSIFPEARIIFAQRHPCDCVLSGFMQSFVMNDAMACFLTIAGAADLYDACMMVWTRNRELVPLPVHDIVYEDLVADPVATIRPLIDFLDLEWREELLDHRATAKGRGAIITPSYDQVTQPLSRDPVGRWKRYETSLQPVLPVLLPWADRLGYAR